MNATHKLSTGWCRAFGYPQRPTALSTDRARCNIRVGTAKSLGSTRSTALYDDSYGSFYSERQKTDTVGATVDTVGRSNP